MSKPLFKYLRPEDMRKLASFEFAPKALAEGYLAGRHKSRARGNSMEFRDYRQFVQGDDPSATDWRVFARSDRKYLRTYEQETNLECHILLDSSASMGYGDGTQTKLEYASFFVAALCHLTMRGGDKVSLTTFDDKIRRHHPPGGTTRHLQSLMHTLESNTPGGRTSLPEALLRAHPLLKRKGTLIVVSDFLDKPAGIFAALSPYLHKRFKVHLLNILAPSELDLSGLGDARFLDMEDGRSVAADATRIRSGYVEAMRDHVNSLRQLSSRKGIEYILARTDAHYFSLFDGLVK